MKPLRQPTMKDVAKLANVSQASVSNVINNKGIVSVNIQNRVNLAIKELGYIPNAIARALKQKSTDTIGLIVPDIGSSFYAEIAKHVEKLLQTNDFMTYLCNTFYDPSLEKQFIENLRQHNVAGVIISYGLIDHSLYDVFIDANIPIIIIDERINNTKEPIASVEMDNLKGSALIVKHLYKLGAKKICFASEPLFDRTLLNRYQGFLNAMEKYGYKIEEDLIFIEKSQYDKLEMGYNIGAKIILEEDIDAVFASSDTLAIGIIQRFKEHNIQIPEDIKIVGYDNIPFAKLVTPSLTTIAQPIDSMSQKSTEILLNEINGVSIEKKDFHLVFEPSLIIRKSTIGNKSKVKRP